MKGDQDADRDLRGFGIAHFGALDPFMSQVGADTVIALNGADILTLKNCAVGQQLVADTRRAEPPRKNFKLSRLGLSVSLEGCGLRKLTVTANGNNVEAARQRARNGISFTALAD
jgi:hypothetical protein